MAALGFVLAAGLYQRLDNLRTWENDPGRFFHDEEPLQMSVDGYYYLGLARALRDGRYEPVDQNRTVPVGRPRPRPPPLLSTLTWLLSRAGHVSLDWVAILLPPLLGVLLALPGYGLGTRLGGRLLGSSAALFAIASPFYVARTMLGWHDTDCLNVTFAVAIPYLLLRFSETETRKRYLHLGAAVATYAAFLCWWDHGRAPATFAFAMPLAVALGFEQRRRRLDRGWFGAALALLTVAVLALYGRELVGTALRVTRYIAKEQVDPFPISGANVVEQTPADLLAIAEFAAGSPLTLALAAIGLGCLVWRRPGQCLFLLFPFLVSCLSFRAIRFVLFMAPLVGLGIGALLHELWHLRRGGMPGRLGAVVVFVVVAWPIAVHFDRDNSYRPRRHPFQVEAMTRMAAVTPQNAVIWADWGHGYPLQYYADRGTIADGGYHSGRLMYVLSVPLATRDFRTAANWIRFYVERGWSGVNEARALFGGEWSATSTHLQRLFGAGPQGAVPILGEFGVVESPQLGRWLRFLFPAEGRPAYVFVDFDKIRTPWFSYGTWDFERSSGKPFAYLPFSGLEIVANRVRNPEIEIDLVSGEARFQGRVFRLARFAWKPPPETGADVRVRNYGRAGLAFRMDEASRSGILLDDEVAQSVGHKLFAGEGVDERYFRLVLSRHPLYRLWEVRGDRYSGGGADGG